MNASLPGQPRGRKTLRREHWAGPRASEAGDGPRGSVCFQGPDGRMKMLAGSVLIRRLIRGPVGAGRLLDTWGLTDGHGGGSANSTQQPNQTKMETRGAVAVPLPLSAALC